MQENTRLVSRRLFVSALAVSSASALDLGFVGEAFGAAPYFSLEDQWERAVTSSVVFKDPTVIIAGDQRETAEAILAWEKSLPGARLFGLANLDGLPFFVPHGAIRKNLRELGIKASVLLDWKGHVHSSLNVPKTRVAVVDVYEAGGRRVHRVEGLPSETNKRRTLEALDRTHVRSGADASPSPHRFAHANRPASLRR